MRPFCEKKLSPKRSYYMCPACASSYDHARDRDATTYALIRWVADRVRSTQKNAAKFAAKALRRDLR